MVVQDLATQWIHSYQCKTKTSQETQKNLMKFLEPTRKPKVIYADIFLEFTSHRSETNGIGERAVRRMKEGTSAVLLQSGLGNGWWADSVECYCYLRNIQDLLSDGKTPHERRFGIPFTEQRSSITLFLRKINPDCLEQKSCLVYFSVMHYTRENLERRHHGRRH